MKSGKRILAGILAAVTVLSSTQFPGTISYAEEPSPVQESISGEEPSVREDTSQQEPVQDQEEAVEKPEQPGAEAPVSAPGENSESKEDDSVQTETPAGEEQPSGQETEEPEETWPADGEDEKNPDETVDENEETSAEFPEDDMTVSENNLQISGNDLMAAEEQEVWVKAELEGAYQFGDAPSEQGSASLYAVSAYAEADLMEYLYHQMRARNKVISVGEYNISVSEVADVFSGVLNEHPDLYYVKKEYECSIIQSTMTVMSIRAVYEEGLDDAKWQSGVNAALAVVDEGMSDLQKAIVLHDYLTVNCEYDQENLINGTVPDKSHSTYGVFADRIAVCDGYALSYKYLLSQVGIDCYMVTSKEINHAWNLIKLDGQYYQVDVTWDDPTWDLVGRSVHTYMFRSDDNFDPAGASQKHSGGRVTYGSQTVDYQATDTRYDDAFWTDSTSPLVFSGSDCYYISFDVGAAQARLKKGSLKSITDVGTTVLDIGRWPVWGSNGYYQSAYSGLFRINDRFYYNDTGSIYSVAVDGTDRKTEFTADTANGYIYGSALCQGKVLYSLHQSPNLQAREVVLEADIKVDGGGSAPNPPAEEEKGLNLDNPSLQFTALDGTTISSTAEGRPKLLIFYSNTCGNCRNTINGISGQISSFAGVDIYAIEVTKQSKADVTLFREKYGCEEIVFSHDTGSTNGDGMWQYAWAVEVNNISWPMICYIDANNRLQYVTFSLIAADAVLSNLRKYCMASEGETFSIQRPAKTTYKVGEKLDVTGGKVTYPDNGAAKSVDMTEGMVSGFDSSVPGICVVTVKAGGYTASFDTLIVEEPELTGVYGQRLSTVLLPLNDHGTYSWQDGTQVMDQLGAQSFGAVFTPADTGKFQVLKDLQMPVNVQSTLGNSIEVTLKRNTFVYSGEEQEPKVVVTAPDLASSDGGSVVLAEGKDYELSYENNRNAGMAVVVVTGKGSYNGSVSKTFQILPAPIQIRAKDRTILIGDAVPANSVYEYEISGLVGTDELLVKPSFSCAVNDTTVPGQYDIVPSGAGAGGNYTIAYENGRLTVASEYVSCTVTFDVQGHGTAPAAQVGIKVGGTAERPANPEEAGYRFDGWYRESACTKGWDFESDIVQADMTLYAKWLEESKEEVEKEKRFAFQEIADVYYTGKACKPAVSVYDGKVLLKSGRDYQIKYYNNTNANKDGMLKQGNGEGVNFNPALPYVEIIGKGNYTDRIKDGSADTVKVNFNILRATIGDGTEKSAAGVTLKVSEQLVAAKKAQKPFSSIKYVKGMKRDVDFRLRLTVENARDQSGKSLPQGSELTNAEIPANYEGEFLLTVEGLGNYTGNICRTIYVADKAHLLKNAKITIGKNWKNVPFTGETIKPTPSETDSPDTFTVKYGSTYLKPGRDYTVQPIPCKVGKVELTIVGTGEYVGTKTATLQIKGKTFSAATVQVSGIEDKTYTGRALTQNNAVLTYSPKDESPKTLRYGTDYTISYTKNINRGSATMTFKGVEQAGYSGSFKKTFKITAVDIADQEQVSRVSAMESMVFPYCKAGVKPVEEIVLTNREGFVLRNGKDYTLAYQNNKETAGVSAEKPPTVTVRGKGNYTGQFEVTFQITKRGLKQAVDSKDIQLEKTGVIYNPNKAEDYMYKPAIKLMDGQNALRVNTDYVLVYEKNTQADYNAYMRVYEEAVKKAESGKMDPDVDRQLQELMPRAVITAQADSNYEADGEIIVPLPIYQTKLVKNGLQIDVVEETIYRGDQVTPAVTVRDIVNGKILENNKDYTVSYGANNKSGKNKGSVTVTGIAPEYGGNVTVKFDIARKPIIY